MLTAFRHLPAGFCALTTTVPEAGHYALHTEDAGTPDYRRSQQNRHQLQLQTGFETLITLRQTHSSIIHTVKAGLQPDWDHTEGDGLITAQKSILLGMLTADCVPVVFTAPGGPAGIVHAGWKGAAAGIQNLMVNKFGDDYGINPAEIRVGIGPHIGGCCYEVGPEFTQTFPARFLRPAGGRFMLNLKDYLISELTACGIRPGHIETMNKCTLCSRDSRFFSYRGGSKKERNLTVCGIFEAGK